MNVQENRPLNLHRERCLLVLGALVVAAVLLSAVALAGCGSAVSPTPTRPSQESTTTAISTTTPLTTTPSPAPTPVEPPSSVPLTVWGPLQFSPGEADAAQLLLQAQYQSFAESADVLEVEYVPRAAYGDSGVVNFLLNASYAAPSLLPDLAIVDPFELQSLVREGLPQPIGDLISEELIEDLYPFAREACSSDGRLVCVQFEADIEHVVYYTGALEEPPVTWADLFTEAISYTFPAAGVGGLVNDTFLIQYLAQGGQLHDEQGAPSLDDSTVQRVLRLYDAVRRWDVSPPSILGLATLDDCWKVYTGGNITVSHMSSHQYLVSRSVMRETDFAAVPTETGAPATMSRGWAFVILAQSPERQEAAADLVEWLMLPENLSLWSEASNHLPTRRSALSMVGWPREYEDFLDNQLESAFHRPSGTQFQRIARALQTAVEAVLTEELTPREATAQVMESLE